MDKKTKLWLGIGVVGVGAYLLFKSRKTTTPALSPAAPANLVGFDTGKFYDVKGGHAGVMGEGVFTNAAGKRKGSVKVEDLGGEFVTGSVQVEDLGGGFADFGGRKSKVKVGKITQTKTPKRYGSVYVAPLESGEYMEFANQPFNFGGNAVVGERKVAFADAMGDRMISADGVGKEFFEPKTKKFTKTPPPKRTLPVMPPERAVPVTQPMPLNNFASAQGAGMINSFSVKGGFDPLVNR
jgi:hypothetical protein